MNSSGAGIARVIRFLKNLSCTGKNKVFMGEPKCAFPWDSAAVPNRRGSVSYWINCLVFAPWWSDNWQLGVTHRWHRGRGTMQARILGSFQIEEGGRRIPLDGVRQRSVFVSLLLHANKVVPSEQLLVDLWGE